MPGNSSSLLSCPPLINATDVAEIIINASLHPPRLYTLGAFMSYALMMAAAGLVASVPHASTTSWLDEQVSGSVHVHSSQTMRGQNMTYKAAKVLEMRACKRCRAGELSVTETGCAHYCSEAGYCGFSPEYRRWNCTKPEEVLEQQGSRIVNPQVNPGPPPFANQRLKPGCILPLQLFKYFPNIPTLYPAVARSTANVAVLTLASSTHMHPLFSPPHPPPDLLVFTTERSTCTWSILRL